MDSKFPTSYYWSGWQKASCLPDCWCEAARFRQMIVEPSNTYSNLFYLFGGLFILWMYQTHKKASKKEGYGLFDYGLFSFAQVFLFLGSGFFHMSLTLVGQWFDLMGMYLVTIYYILFFLRAKYRFSHWKFLGSYIGINILMGLIIYYFPASRRYLFIITVFVTLGLAVKYVFMTSLKFKTQPKYFYLSIAAIIGGQIAWNLDRHRILCAPKYWLTGHSIWHLLAAISAVYFFKFLIGIPNSSETAKCLQERN